MAPMALAFSVVTRRALLVVRSVQQGGIWAEFAGECSGGWLRSYACWRARPSRSGAASGTSINAVSVYVLRCIPRTQNTPRLMLAHTVRRWWFPKQTVPLTTLR